jgi:5-methylcytosine-specific restriction endonuclease McrA
MRKWIDAHPEEHRRRSLESAKKAPDKHREYSRKHYHKNRDRILVQKTADRLINPEKYRRYAKANPANVAHHCAHRRAVRLAQTCGCCTNSQLEEFYALATLVGGEVDHRIPLALGGHHCTKNLQALTYEDHREKTKADFRTIAAAKRRSKLLLQWPIAAAA